MLSLLYKTLLRRLLFSMDAEQAHHLAMRLLSNASRSRSALAILRWLAGASTIGANLERRVFGLRFPNPIGLAAGFDKDAVALPAWEALGFGFVEAGTLTPQPQPGNPKPRLFRLPEQRGLINRLGFNNGGVAPAGERLTKLRDSGRWPAIPVGINIGKNKATPLEDAVRDYVDAFGAMHAFGDYFVLNVSSPNTPGLRGLQEKDELDGLLRAVQEKNRGLAKPRPLLVKIAPDLTFEQIEEIIGLSTRHELAGIVATNTTIDHSALPGPLARQQGGLSGEPLRQRATEVVRFISKNSTLPIIAVGGVSDAQTAKEKLDAGASLVQLYTGFVYGGPGLAPEICRGLRSF